MLWKPLPDPALDRLSKEGIRFQSAHTASPICTPSRYSYFTGRYPGRCPHMSFTRGNHKGEIPIVGFNTSIHPGDDHLGSILKANGYATGYVGKYHVGREHGEIGGKPIPNEGDPHDPEADAVRKANQEVYREELKRLGWDYSGGISWANIDNLEPPRGWNHNQEWITDHALRFLERQRGGDGPFCLYMATNVNHGPNHGTNILEIDPRISLGGMLDETPGVQPSRRSIVNRLEAAGVGPTHRSVGMLWLDDAVDAVVEKLKDLGAYEDTVVVYMADHGVVGKWSLHENGTRIPLIWKPAAGVPECAAGGHLSRVMVQNIDFLPTLAEVCGLELPTDMHPDGASYAAALRGEQTAVHEELFFEYGTQRAVRTNRFKYIAARYRPVDIEKMRSGRSTAINGLGKPGTNRVHKYQRHTWEPDQLYDLWNDPEEQMNLATWPEYQDILADIKKRLAGYIEEMGYTFPLEPDPYQLSDHFKSLARAATDLELNRLPNQPWWAEGWY